MRGVEWEEQHSWGSRMLQAGMPICVMLCFGFEEGIELSQPQHARVVLNCPTKEGLSEAWLRRFFVLCVV